MARGPNGASLADIYGPSEGVIGKYLQSTPEARSKVQVLTKFCCFGQSMDFADNPKYVKRVPLLPFCKACYEYVRILQAAHFLRACDEALFATYLLLSWQPGSCQT